MPVCIYRYTYVIYFFYDVHRYAYMCMGNWFFLHQQRKFDGSHICWTLHASIAAFFLALLHRPSSHLLTPSTTSTAIINRTVISTYLAALPLENCVTSPSLIGPRSGRQWHQVCITKYSPPGTSLGSRRDRGAVRSFTEHCTCLMHASLVLYRRLLLLFLFLFVTASVSCPPYPNFSALFSCAVKYVYEVHSTVRKPKARNQCRPKGVQGVI